MLVRSYQASLPLSKLRQETNAKRSSATTPPNLLERTAPFVSTSKNLVAKSFPAPHTFQVRMESPNLGINADTKFLTPSSSNLDLERRSGLKQTGWHKSSLGNNLRRSTAPPKPLMSGFVAKNLSSLTSTLLAA